MNNLIKNIKKINIKQGLDQGYKYLKKYKENDYKKYINLDNKVYKRSLVYRDKDFEIMIISWNINQKSKIHNHSSNGCLFKVLEGNIKESLFNIEDIKLEKK